MQHRPVRIRFFALAAVALAVAGLTSACGSSGVASDPSSSLKVTIRYQTSPGLINLAEMASALGYIPDITLKDVGVVQGGPEAMQALATGQVDLAGSFVGAVANVVSNGTPIKAVIAYYGSDSKAYDEILVRTGSGISKPSDLIGKKVGVNTLGAQAEALIDLWLKKNGLTEAQINQVTLVPLPSIDIEAALRHGQIDAGLFNGALLTKAVQGGGLTSIMKDTDVFGDYNGGSYEMADSWLAAHPAAATEFVTGMAKAIHYIKTHSASNVLGIYDKWLTAHGEQDDVSALSTWVSTGIATPYGQLSNADFTRWIPWLQEKGLLKASLNASSLYTNKYNKYATGSGSN